MSDDEQCGAETQAGEPCKLPAGSCPHHETESGWPRKLREREEDILEAARRGTTKEGCARVAGVSEQTLYNWLNTYIEFFESFTRARAKGEQVLLEHEDTSPEFLLERSYDYTKTQEIEHSGDVVHEHGLGEDERELALETIRQLQREEMG